MEKIFIFTETQVKELLRKQREECYEAYKYNDGVCLEYMVIVNAPSPELEGGINLPTKEDILKAAVSSTINISKSNMYTLDNFRIKFEQGANFVLNLIKSQEEKP